MRELMLVACIAMAFHACGSGDGAPTGPSVTVTCVREAQTVTTVNVDVDCNRDETATPVIVDRPVIP